MRARSRRLCERQKKKKNEKLQIPADVKHGGTRTFNLSDDTQLVNTFIFVCLGLNDLFSSKNVKKKKTQKNK